MIDFIDLDEVTLKLKNEIKKISAQNPIIYELWFNDMSVERMTDMIICISVMTEIKKVTIETK